MSNEDGPEIRQRNELEALQAIFGDDLRDVRGKAAWNSWKPLNLIITLMPQQSSGLAEAYCQVDLHVVCSDRYPEIAPKIMLEKSQGMSTTTIKELVEQLENKAKSLVGEVMIFELAQYVQTFLHQHNKPTFKSFYEEMLTRQKEQEQIDKLALQEQQEREREVMLSEIQQRQDILKKEAKIRRDSNSFSSDADADLNGLNNSSVLGKGKIICNHKGTKVIEFSNNGIREIQRGKCTSHQNEKCTLFSGLDIETGELFNIWEWTIEINEDNNQIQRQLSSIEQEFNYLVKLKHPNLVHYVNIKQENFSQENKLVVSVLQEFVTGLQCSSAIFKRNVMCEIDLLRNISKNVLSALEFLHRNNVVHKNISESCIYIKPNGEVLVANYSIDKRLSDLINQNSLCNYSKKNDIFKFGILFLSVLKGVDVSEETFEIPLTVSPELYDFLSKCLAKEEKERYTAVQLLNHQFIRMPLEKYSPQRIIDVGKNDNVSPEPPVDTSFIQAGSGSQSRVQSEFEVLQFIGKGAFGDVLKVRNKLDGGNYAIKRIQLNPKSKQLNKKIIREVKLLSKLNHENVVRYYNAWIETAEIECDDSDSYGLKSSDFMSPIARIIQQKELTFKNDVELLAPPMKDVVEWSHSKEGKSKSRPGVNSESSSEESDEEWGVMVNVDSSDSSSIEFERGETETSDSKSFSVRESESATSASKSKCMEIQFLYIQMEFCEKSTLRTAIDSNLYLDVNRVWRLFREIVEGLAHIHQQGMIHRDLKPVNIFLDSNDHVKIGDFGLATTNVLCKYGENINKTAEDMYKGQSIEDAADASLTGQVGTALYTAPELNTTTKSIYNQKVDIYSLGIIFFEMCYVPLTTQMERMKILSGIRLKEVVFPVDFKEKCLHKQETLIKWLLNHDVSQRPTSQELLQSELIPPPVLEEEKLREMFSHTLKNPQLKAYKYLIASCFDQPVTPPHDITYDMDITMFSLTKSTEAYQYVKNIVTTIFKLHGGQNIPTPVLLPKTKFYVETDTCVKLMTHSGSIVSLPHDLRIPFARYVAFNGINLLKRFCIERVYRERKVFGYHPRELYECAFDIVTPSLSNFIPDAEILFIVNEIIDALPCLKNTNFLIRLNHTSLIQAILLHCGIKEKQNEVCSLLSDMREGKVTKFQIKTFLIGLGLSDLNITTLLNLVELENTLPKIVTALQLITRKKSTEASKLAKQALEELKIIVQNANLLGVTFNMIIVPGLVYNVQQYSGMMCQFVCELKKKRRNGDMEVLAAGGRYDSVIYHYRHIKEHAGKSIRQFAVGISLSLDKLVQAVQKVNTDELFRPLDCIISSVDSKVLMKEKVSVLKNMWSSGIRCTLVEAATLEEVQEYCGELKVPHLIILKDSPQGTARIRSWERDRFQEKTVYTLDLVESMQKIIKMWDEGCNEQVSNNSIVRSDSKSMTSERTEHNHEPMVTVLFVTSVCKLSANARRRYENQIRSQLDNTFKKLVGEVVVIGLDLDAEVIRTLSSFLNFETEQTYQSSVACVVERHPRHKKYITELCDEIYEQQSKRSKPIITLYSIADSFYKCIL